MAFMSTDIKKIFLIVPILFLALGALFIVACHSAPPNPESAQVSPSVEILRISGRVTVLISGETDWRDVKEAMLLHAGDSIKTYDNSFAEIAFNAQKSNVIKVQPCTYVILRLGKSQKIELMNGELLSLIRNLPNHSTFEIRTPTAICGVRGTKYKVVAIRERSFTQVAVLQKSVVLKSIKEPFKSVTVKELQQREICPWKKTILSAKGRGILSKEILGPMTSKDATSSNIHGINEREYGETFGALARVTTKRAAVTDAYRKVAEKIYGVVIDSKTTLEDYAITDDTIRTTVKGIVRGAREISTRYYSDGSIEVIMETEGTKVKKDLTPLTGDIFGIDCIPGPEVVRACDFEEFLLQDSH